MVMAPIDRFPRPLPQPQPNQELLDRMAFRMLDGDGNDALSQKEWQKAGWSADRFEAFDGDGDGKVSEKEFLQARRYEREFNAKDLNDDGALSRTELSGIRKLYHGVAGKVSDALGGAKGLVKCIPPFPGLTDRFKRFDADGDGKVTKGEYMQGRRKEESMIRPLPMPVPRPLPWIAGKDEIKRLPLDAKVEKQQ